MAAGFEIPRERGFREAILNAAVSYGIATGRTTIERRREARGRRGETVMDTFRLLLILLIFPTFAFAIYLTADAKTGFIVRLTYFVLLIPLLAFVATLAAWTTTVISLASIEMAYPMRRTWVHRPGHYLTLDEVRLQQQRWADIAFSDPDQILGSPVSLIGGPDTMQTEALSDRERALQELSRSMALGEQVANGARVWVDD